MKILETANELREKIKRLEAENRTTTNQSHRQLDAMRNRLANMTAKAFVAIDANNGLVTQGVSPETPVTIGNLLSISFREDGKISVRKCFGDGELTIFLAVGGQASFEVVEYDREDRPFIYHIRAFATRKEAKAWADQRLQNTTSR